MNLENLNLNITSSYEISNTKFQNIQKIGR